VITAARAEEDAAARRRLRAGPELRRVRDPSAGAGRLVPGAGGRRPPPPRHGSGEPAPDRRLGRAHGGRERPHGAQDALRRADHDRSRWTRSRPSRRRRRRRRTSSRPAPRRPPRNAGDH